MSSIIRSVDLFNESSCFHASFYGKSFDSMYDSVPFIRNYMDTIGGYKYAVVNFMDNIVMIIYPDFVSIHYTMHV